MERFLITAPFSYRFGIDIRQFQAGDIYVIHPEDRAQELEYWLSDSFEYKNFVHHLAQEPATAPIVFSSVPEDKPGVAEAIAAGAEPEEVLPIEPVAFASDSEAVEELIVDEPEPYSASVRKKELESLPWQEVKAIFENLGGKYSNKAEAIENIIRAEFK